MHVTRTISLPEDLDAALEHQRGDIPRSLFVRRALEAYVGRQAIPAPSAVRALPDSVFVPEKPPKRRMDRQARLNKAKGL